MLQYFICSQEVFPTLRTCTATKLLRKYTITSSVQIFCSNKGLSLRSAQGAVISLHVETWRFLCLDFTSTIATRRSHANKFYNYILDLNWTVVVLLKKLCMFKNVQPSCAKICSYQFATATWQPPFRLMATTWGPPCEAPCSSGPKPSIPKYP